MQYYCCAVHYDLTRRCNIASTGQRFDSIFLFFLLLKLLFLTTASFIDSPLSLSVTLSHSFTPGLKPSFSTNPSLSNPSFSSVLTPRTVTSTSEHIRIRFFKFFFNFSLFFYFLDSCGILSCLMPAFERTLK